MTARTVKQCQAWHETTSLGLHARSDDVGRGMSSPPLDNTHGRMTSGKTCHHRLWTAHTVERRRAWHAINAFGQHTRSNDVGRGMESSLLGSTDSQTASSVASILALGRKAWSNDVGCGMSSSPLGSTNGRMTSGMACHHRLWAAHTVEQLRAWHAIIAI